MEKILERLERSLRWTLLAPDSARLPAAMTRRASAVHPQLLHALQAARVAVFGLDDSEEHEPVRTTDRAAWHFIATDGEGKPVGAMRLFIVDRRHEPLEPPDVLAFGHVAFPCPATRDSHLRALKGLFAQKAEETTYIYAGGFFTTEKWRGSGLAAALGMAAIAMARLHHCRFAASFVSARDRAPELFALLGSLPLQDADGSVLPPFFCSRHGFPLQLMAFDSLRPDPKMEHGVDAMVGRMREMLVITPPCSAPAGPSQHGRLQPSQPDSCVR